MKQGFYHYFQRFTAILYFLLTGIALFLLLFYAHKTDYYLKTEFLLSNGTLLCIGFLLFLLLIIPIYRFRKALERFLALRYKWIFLIAVIFFFSLQCIFAINAFFYSDWDPAGVLSGAYNILRGKRELISIDYFSAHPNNLMLVWIYLAVLKLAGLFGTESVLSLVLFQCVLFQLTGILIYRILKDLLKSRTAAGFVYIFFSLYAGLSPWLLITYSDSVGLIMPVAILRLFQKSLNTDSRKALYWGLIGVLTAFGYAIKPQIVIAAISVVLIGVLRATDRAGRLRAEAEESADNTGAVEVLPTVNDKQALRNSSGKIFRRIISPAAFIMGIVFMRLIINFCLIPSLGLTLDSDKAFGMAHYFMMGLNNETDGVYSNEDTNFTNSIPWPELRTKYDMALAEERLKAYGVSGLFRHLMRKTLVNFGDGTFAWGIDGNFFAGSTLGDMPPVRERAMTEKIRSWIWTDGANYPCFSTAQQLIWIMLLFLSLFSIGFYLRKSEKRRNPSRELDEGESVPPAHVTLDYPIIGAIQLNLIGLTLFELLFEAKARYLFIGVPFFILLAAIGVCAALKIPHFINAKIRKK